MPTDSTAANQPSPQHRAVGCTAGLTQALTLEVDTDYYEALEGSEFDWQALARSRTGTRVHWADTVVSPEKRRNIASTESWHDENATVDELEEYSSWQISLGIANERAALTGPGQPTIDEFAPWQQRLGLQAALEEQARAAAGEGAATPLPREAVAKYPDYDIASNIVNGGTAVSLLLHLPPKLRSHRAATPNRPSSSQGLSSQASMPRSPRFSFRRRNSAPVVASGKKKSILRDRSRHQQPKPLASSSSASFASPRWRSHDSKGHMRVITNKS